MQQGYLCPKTQNYLLGKADLGFFLRSGWRTTIKITIFSTFYVIDNVSSCYSPKFVQKNTDSFNKKFFKVKIKHPNMK